jgi:hypothetical protein
MRRRMSNRWMLLEKSIESGGGKRTRRAAADLPVLQRAHADRQPSGEKNRDSLRLAQIVGLSPNLESFDNWSDGFPHTSL